MALAVGFTLTFGAFFAKTWRVYKIFTASEKLKKVVRKLCFFFFALFFDFYFAQKKLLFLPKAWIYADLNKC